MAKLTIKTHEIKTIQVDTICGMKLFLDYYAVSTATCYVKTLGGWQKETSVAVRAPYANVLAFCEWVIIDATEPHHSQE